MKLPRKIPFDVIKHLKVSIFKKKCHCCHGNKTDAKTKNTNIVIATLLLNRIMQHFL